MLSDKQIELLNKIYIPFKEKYNVTLDEFVFKFCKKETSHLTHQNLFFLIQNVNSGYDYWRERTEYKVIKPSFNKLQYIIKEENDDYIIGTQYHYTTYLKDTIKHTLEIIAFKYLMILDYDVKSEVSKADLLEEITEGLIKTDCTFLIYETTNGYHAYNISKKYLLNNDTFQYMNKLKCDSWYINFTKYVGFVTRLEKKKNREEIFIEKFIKQINEYPIDNHVKELVEIKDKLIN
jgi:hypothetical protein